jgi:hypothetical protein
MNAPAARPVLDEDFRRSDLPQEVATDEVREGESHCDERRHTDVAAGPQRGTMPERRGRARAPASPVPGECRVRRMRRTHGHGCAGRPQRSRVSNTVANARTGVRAGPQRSRTAQRRGEAQRTNSPARRRIPDEEFLTTLRADRTVSPLTSLARVARPHTLASDKKPSLLLKSHAPAAPVCLWNRRHE